MDLFATIVEVTDAKLPTDRKIDGHNILPLLKGEAKSPTQKLFYFNGAKAEAVREGIWKLRVTKANGVQLFNLKNDPAEKYNLANENPKLVEELHKKLNDFSTETGGEPILLTD